MRMAIYTDKSIGYIIVILIMELKKLDNNYVSFANKVIEAKMPFCLKCGQMLYIKK